ncbi:MAG: LysR family transcriptional regulator [Burkholderiales bacterium]
MDTFSAMTTFVRIAELGSLTAASVALDTSLPTVVRTLAGLEKRLGTRLFNRTTRRLSLTDEGAQYLQHCKAILLAVQEAETSLASRRATPQGRLAITASVLFGRRYVAPIVCDFLLRHPAVSAQLTLLDRVVHIVEEGFDLGIRIGHLNDSSLIAIPVGEVRRVACASPGYLRKAGAPRHPEDLRHHRCVNFLSLTPGSEWNFQSARRILKVPITPLISSNQVDAAVEACVKGLGLGLFLSYQVAPERRANKLSLVLEKFEPPPLPVHVVYPHSKMMSATVRAFVDASVDVLRKSKFD